MPTLSAQDFRDRVGNNDRLLAQCVHGAFGVLGALLRAEGGRFGRSLTTRTHANLLHDYVIEEATERLPFNHLLSNGVHLWQVEDLAFRFKKLDDNTGLPSNISTAHNSALCNDGEHPEIFEDLKPSYLTVGYDVSRDWTRLGDVWVMYMVDEYHLSWTLRIRPDGAAVPMDQLIGHGVTTPKPRSKIKSKTATRKPKGA